ncbi:MAG: M48 family metallopeptidase [Acidobacteriaceae bacterium]|jgi:Zn-dependent protease with chaperone function
MRYRGTLVLMVALAAGLALTASRLGYKTSTEAKAEQFAAHNSTAYTLPAGELDRAIALNRTRMTLEVVGDVWILVELLLILAVGAAARMRDAAVGVSKSRWVQGFSFVFLLLLLTHLLNLPLGIYGHRVALSYGLSVQGWGSWLADKGKMFALEWLIGGLLVMLMFRIIRKSPARWWFWFWIPAVVCVLAGVFATPYVIDPMFYRFEPLGKTDPALVQRLEQVVARGGIAIPPDRMFLMKASAKSTELNAYVTGFGASKRVVVWDTTIARSTPDEISFIFAHEMGHYALGHVVLGVALSCVGLLPCFWITYHGVRLLLGRYGAAWRIPSQQDWGALVVLALVLLTLSAISDPIANGISRSIEHNADVYGQEAVHGIVADPQAVGLRTFQVLGEDSLDDPTPHPLFEWWFDTHPTTRFRAAFAEAYDPWAVGEAPKYFAK